MILKRRYLGTKTIIEQDQDGNIIVNNEHVYDDVLVDPLWKRLVKNIEFIGTIFYIIICCIAAFVVYESTLLIFLTGMLTHMHIYRLLNIIKEEKNKYL